MNANSEKSGFTLSEVLITLAIIGVVAALTIPSIVQHYKKTVVETRLKAFYVTMNQAIRLSEIENGSTDTWELMDSTFIQDIEVLQNWFDKYLKKYLNVTKTDEVSILTTEGTLRYTNLAIYLANGSVFCVQGNTRKDVTFYVDEKALKNPLSGRNCFLFRIPLPSSPSDLKYYNGAKFEPYAYNWDGTRESLISNSRNYGCADEYPNYCAKLIQESGWKIPDDYPWKF